MSQQDLTKIDIFKGLNKWQVDELLSWVVRKEYPAGFEIFREGQMPDGLYILTDGTVSVTKLSKLGKFALANVDAPSYFGEMGLLSGEMRSAGVKAKTNVICGFLASSLFTVKLHAHNLTALLIAVNLGRLLAQRLREANQRIAAGTSIMASRRRR